MNFGTIVTEALTSMLIALASMLSRLTGVSLITPPNYFSPFDGKFVRKTDTTLSCIAADGGTLYRFTVDSTQCNVVGIHVTRLDGTVVHYKNGENGISISASSNIIMISGAGATPFLATDTKYQVSINYQQKAYDGAKDVSKFEEQNGLNKNHTDAISLVDTTNVAAGTNYYPSTSGLLMDTFKSICFQQNTAGGVTTTYEATNDPAASPDWVDVTKSGKDMVNNTTGNANYIDSSTGIQWEVLNFKYVRIKSVTADNSNTVQYSYRQIPL